MLAMPSAVLAAEPSAHTRALAAGYKAAFVCSGIFNAGQTKDMLSGGGNTGMSEFRGWRLDIDACYLGG